MFANIFRRKKPPIVPWQRGLSKTRRHLGDRLAALFGNRARLDATLAAELESLLLAADVGLPTTERLLENLKKRASTERADADLMGLFRDMLIDLLAAPSAPLRWPADGTGLLLLVGVNGVGKTTSAAKLAHRFKGGGKSVLLAAGDTFRAAAIEQLQIWGRRIQVPVVAQGAGADSASVIFDALQAARARGVDRLIADTAGRLHNKGHLLDELGKIVRVVRKLDARAPHEIWLVLDAATGQNALNQAREFCRAVPVTGLVLNRLDGTAKGGVLLALASELRLPVRFVGLGEGLDDLAEFNPAQFVAALLGS